MLLRSLTALVLLAACAPSLLLAACTPSRGPSVAEGTPPPPIEPPGVGSGLCVESRDLREYVLALDAERAAARERALAAHAARVSRRRAVFLELEPGVAASPGAERRLGDARYLLVGHFTMRGEPTTEVALEGDRVRPLDERPRAHAVSLRVCGTGSCPGETGVAPSSAGEPRPLWVELAPSERAGPPLLLEYDSFWVCPDYDRPVRCDE